MQLFSVENLSIAAEVTVVLLLLSFALPRKKTHSNVEILVNPSTDWEPAKRYFLNNCVHRGLYLQQWRERHRKGPTYSDSSVPYIPNSIDDDPTNPRTPVPWQDRLTRLLNREGFDAVLNLWLSIEPKHRTHSCLSMISLSDYSGLVGTHGAMVTEQAVMQIARQLTENLSSESLVARYLPDRFVVLHFASKLGQCHDRMECLHGSISAPNFFCTAGKQVSLATLSSIVGLDENANVAMKIDELEEGIAEADRTEQSTVSNVNKVWTSSPKSEEIDCQKSNGEPQGIQEPESLDGTCDNSDDSSSTSVPPAFHPDAEESPTVLDALRDKEDVASIDISAVANADDIAALFDSMKAGVVSTPSANTSEANPTPVLAKQKDLLEAATVDDSAALFASAKSAVVPHVHPVNS